MTFSKLLVANRGEIAIRILRAARELDLPSVSIYSEDDAASLHVRFAGESRALKGAGAAAYLDIEQVIAAAKTTGADAIHPGYGFLAENADFAARCEAEGITFVGPSADVLRLYGDKLRARALAAELGVPVLPGTKQEVTLDEARTFFAGHAASGIVIKAVAGGGGRGMRIVRDAGELEEAFARCASEAKAAFGNGALYAEELFPRARHIEVQVLGDGGSDVAHLGERECSLQRRHQKLVEFAPSPWLPEALRTRICEAALTLAEASAYRGLGTFEFLVDTAGEGRFVFIEANPRLQVEHTVTEEVTGVDLVQAQLRIAAGETLRSLGLDRDHRPEARGFAIQARVNMEHIAPDGSVLPRGGTLAVFVPAQGPGVRVDSYGYPGYTTSPNFDSLLAKVIVYVASGFPAATRRMRRALDEFHIDGVETNIPLLGRILAHPDFERGDIFTNWLDENIAQLAAEKPAPAEAGTARPKDTAGAVLDKRDPLAALAFFREGAPTRSDAPVRAPSGPPNTTAVGAPLQGTVSEVHVQEGDTVRRGQQLFIMSALKMEHVIKAETGGVVRSVTVSPGDTVYEGYPLAFVEPMEVGAAIVDEAREIDLDYVYPKLQELFDRREFLRDENRPEAVERRHSRGRRTVRENIDQLFDPGTWLEYGGLVIAGQRARRSLEELIRKTPADGLVAGIGSVNGKYFDEKRAQTMFISYDDTVLAGTQGVRGHDKTDRMIELADELSLPLIFHAEGAGGRSGDTEVTPGMHPSVRTFERMAQLSGKVPMIGVTAGWCYAGNAAILGLTDIIIATEDALIAMGGPATIEGGGLGAFLPEEVGPIKDIAPAGTVDIVVKNQDEAIAVSKKCLSYFQGSISEWKAADQRELRHVIPENRLRGFDVRRVIELLADEGSVLELRPDFGMSMVTAFIRIEGHPFGLTANNNGYIGGAIDSPGSDKVARFWQLCDAFNIPIITLVDTPGMMVGPDVEKSGLVRHCSRLFVTGANLETPRFGVVLRKGYALGSLAVMTGSSRAPLFTVAWPESEFAGMNVEAGVLLSYRDALSKIEDVDARAAEFERLVAVAYERGSAISNASVLGIDDVIDPAETRRWIVNVLKSVPESEPLRRGRRTFLDTW